MNNHDYKKHLAKSARVAVALCALAALGGRSAQAQATAVTLPSQLGNTTLTQQYPFDTNNPVVPASFNRQTVDGSNTLTFTALNAVPPSAGSSGGGFAAFQVRPTDAAPQFSMAPFGMINDIAENTTFNVGGATGNVNTGPLEIQFANPVSGFGLLAQDSFADTETFTLNLFSDFNATIPIVTPMPLTFTADNSVGLGQALFVGARTTSGLPLIRSATLSSLSNASGSFVGNNDFAFGRTFVAAPVPESSTAVGFGMGVLLFTGLALGARKRKVNGASGTGASGAGAEC